MASDEEMMGWKQVLLSGYYKEIGGCGFFKSREWGQRGEKKCQRECLFSSSSFILSGCLLPTVCKYRHNSVSFTLSLFKRGGKDTHPAAFAAAPDFSPLSSQEVSLLPLCWLSGEAQWCWNSGWCTHWLGSMLMHCEHARIHMYTQCHTLADALGPVRRNYMCALSHTRRRTVDKTYASEGATLALSVFIALINDPLASARHSLWPTRPIHL